MKHFLHQVGKGAKGRSLICQETLAQTVRGQTRRVGCSGSQARRLGQFMGEPQEGEETSRGAEDTSLWKEAVLSLPPHAARP